NCCQGRGDVAWGREGISAHGHQRSLYRGIEGTRLLPLPLQPGKEEALQFGGRPALMKGRLVITSAQVIGEHAAAVRAFPPECRLLKWWHPAPDNRVLYAKTRKNARQILTVAERIGAIADERRLAVLSCQGKTGVEISH